MKNERTETHACDLISRAAAIEALGEAPKFKIGLLKKYAEGRNDQWFDDVAALVKLPSAQPERKTGRWIPQDHNRRNGYVTTTVYYYPKCSECGRGGNYDMSYCPNCGAWMGGDEE